MNNKPYILYADDYIKNIVKVQEMLQDSYELKFINTGQDCLDSIVDRTPDLIILGESLPLFDDEETIHLLRADSHYKEIPLVLLSASLLNDEIEAECEGLFALHEKPFDKNKLLSSIYQLLNHTETIMH